MTLWTVLLNFVSSKIEKAETHRGEAASLTSTNPEEPHHDN